MIPDEPQTDAAAQLEQIQSLATAWAAGATTGSDYHRALRSCADQVRGVLTDPQMGLVL